MIAPRVALLIESSNAYSQGLLKGVADFVQRSGPWAAYLPETGRGEGVAEVLRGWRGEGAIVRAETAAMADAVKACACPVVHLSVTDLLPNVPSIHSDVRAEAELAFSHLWERGFRHLAFCGIREYAWAECQMQRFKALASAAGVTVQIHLAPLHLKRPKDWAAERKKLIGWLRKLPKPTGIFACYDMLGQEVVDVCHEARINVPDDVAVIGVDDDALRCGLSLPPLSSVAPDSRRVGYLAAELLAKMMKGEKVSARAHLVPPLGVVARGSTDALAVHDPDVAGALQYIRAHACRPISVKHLLDVVPLSRRSLESRFARVVGRTPHEQILHCRVERAKQLLHDTDLPIKSIAAMVGAGTPEYLAVFFRRMVGASPSEYRLGHNYIAARSAPVAAAVRRKLAKRLAT